MFMATVSPRLVPIVTRGAFRGAGYVLSERVHGGTRRDDRQCRLAVDPARTARVVSGLQWTIDAYTLVIACLLMLSGSLAIASAAAGLQIGLERSRWVVAVQPGSVARVADRLCGLQAVGGSMLNPVRCRSSPTRSPTAPGARRRSACGIGRRTQPRQRPVLGACWLAGSGGVRSSGSTFRRTDRDRAHAAVRARVAG